MQVGHMPGDCERFIAAAALKRLQDLECIGEAPRDGGHITRRARPTMQQNHSRSHRTIPADADRLRG